MKTQKFISATTAAVASALSVGAAETAPQRPNIVLFMVDDMGWQDTSVPFYKERTPLNDRYRTPNMERLAAMGVKFTQAYACAISSPSRASLMTGMNQARHRVTNWTLEKDRKTDHPLPDVEIPDWNCNGIQPVDTINNTTYCTPFPEILRQNGYHTIHVGKAHFGAIDTPSADPLTMGFDVNIAGGPAGGPANGGYLGQNRYGHNPDGTPASKFATPGLEQYWGKDVFLTEALTLEALKELDKSHDSGKPFYLYMSHYAVHVPFVADNRFIDNYETLDGKESKYAALIEGMDKSLGDILDYLEKNKLADNTIVIFMSDNGGLDCEARGQMPDGAGTRCNFPLRSGKGSVYEGGVREPMMVYWNGVTKPGTSCDDYLIIEDFFPTILEMAGINDYQTVQKVDGKSFVPLLKGTADSAWDQRPLFWNTPQNWTNCVSPQEKRRLGLGQTCAVRQGDYKLVYWYTDGTRELFNVADDIAETRDLAAEMPEKVEELSRELGEFLRGCDAQRPSPKSGTQVGAPFPWPDGVK